MQICCVCADFYYLFRVWMISYVLCGLGKFLLCLIYSDDWKTFGRRVSVELCLFRQNFTRQYLWVFSNRFQSRHSCWLKFCERKRGEAKAWESFIEILSVPVDTIHSLSPYSRPLRGVLSSLPICLLEAFSVERWPDPTFIHTDFCNILIFTTRLSSRSSLKLQLKDSEKKSVDIQHLHRVIPSLEY